MDSFLVIGVVVFVGKRWLSAFGVAAMELLVVRDFYFRRCLMFR